MLFTSVPNGPHERRAHDEEGERRKGRGPGREADHKHCTCTTQGIYCRVGIGLLSAREEGPKEGAYLRMLAFLHQEAIKELNWDREVWAPATGPLLE